MRRLVLVLLALAVVVAVPLVARQDGEAPQRLTGQGEHYSVSVTLDRVGPGVVNAEIVTSTTVDAVWLSAAMPDMGHAMPETPAGKAGRGRFLARGELFAMPGVWELGVRLQGKAGSDVITFNVLIES